MLSCVNWVLKSPNHSACINQQFKNKINQMCRISCTDYSSELYISKSRRYRRHKHDNRSERYVGISGVRLFVKFNDNIYSIYNLLYDLGINIMGHDLLVKVHKVTTENIYIMTQYCFYY